MTTDDARLQRLSRELFFAAAATPREVLPSWVIERMTSLLDELDVTPGQVLFAAGDPAEFIYFMSDGRVALTREGAVPWRYEGRWAIGVFEVMVDGPRTRTATALSSFRLMRVKADDWLDLLEDSFVLGRAALENSARTVAALAERLSASGIEPDPITTASLMPLPEGRLNLIERLAVLYELDQLRGSGVQALSEMAALAEETTFEAGERILEVGRHKDRTFVVLEGMVEASRSAPSITRLFGPGTLVCGPASFGDPSVPWGAHAKTRARTLAIHHDGWFDLLEENFDMLRAALRGMALAREKILEQMAAQSGELVLR
jgi:CRP-like cAMP-binding protein